MARLQHVRFRDKPLLLLNGDCLTTEYRFRNGFPSYAQLFPNGRIMRWKNQIGTTDEVVRSEVYLEIEPTEEAIAVLLFGPMWVEGDDPGEDR